MGAANNLGWLGPILVLVTVPLQIYLLTEQHRAEFFFILLCGVSGFLLETLMIVGDVYIPVGRGDLQLCPPWMAALWFNFGMLVTLSLSWLKGKYWLAGILGGLAGPVAYWGGEKLGALTVANAFFRGYLPLGLVWTLALPSLVYLHRNLISTKKT